MTLTSKSLWSRTSAGWCLVQDLQGQERKQSDFCWRIMTRFNYGQFMEEIPAITLLKPTHCGCWDGHIWHQQEPSRTLAKEKKKLFCVSCIQHRFQICSEITTFERFNLCISIRGRWEVTTKDKTSWRHGGITWKKKAGGGVNHLRLSLSADSLCVKLKWSLWRYKNTPENIRLSFSTTSMLSSHTSETMTNIASSFSSSSCLSFAEDFTEVADGPPKKFISP